jgi:hypothetical protein
VGLWQLRQLTGSSRAWWHRFGSAGADKGAHSGTSVARAGRKGASPGVGRTPARAAPCSASRTGRSGTSYAVEVQRPASTRPPCPLTHAENSRTSRLFPTPALPRTTTNSPAFCHADCNQESSWSRPIITGERITPGVAMAISLEISSSRPPSGRHQLSYSSGRLRTCRGVSRLPS